jgi:carbonic anhydrase
VDRGGEAGPPSADELLAGNRAFAADFPHAALGRPPARAVAILTCMDARIDPLALLGLELGDAGVVRNAGGVVTDDVVRSLAVAHALLGVEEVHVIGHTDCGLTSFTEEEIGDRVRARTGTDPAGLEFGATRDVDGLVREGVRRLETSPILRVAASGWVYDVKTGALRQVT